MSFRTNVTQDTPTQKTIEVTIPKKETERHFSDAAAVLSLQHPIKGFREGKAPLALVMKTFGQAKVLQEVMRLTLNEYLPAILKDEKRRIIGEPLVRFTQADALKGIVFTITLGYYPQNISLEYATVRIKREKPKVKDEEIERTLNLLKDHRKAKTIDDNFARQVGNFSNLADLKQSIKEGLLHDKERLHKEQSRAKLLDTIVGKTSIPLPDFVVIQETERRLTQYRKDLEQKGMSWEDYLARVKKKEKDLQKEEAESVRRLLEHAIVLDYIAKKEGIRVSEEEITREFNRLLSSYRSVEEAERNIDIPQTKQRIAQNLLYQHVFEHVLDKQVTT